MDGLVEELFRLESAKHRALVLIDAPAYEATVREQMRLLAEWKEPNGKVSSVERLLALSQLITLNTRLLQNLMLTTPVFRLVGNGYTDQGRVPVRAASRVSVKA